MLRQTIEKTRDQLKQELLADAANLEAAARAIQISVKKGRADIPAGRRGVQLASEVSVKLTLYSKYNLWLVRIDAAAAAKTAPRKPATASEAAGEEVAA